MAIPLQRVFVRLSCLLAAAVLTFGMVLQAAEAQERIEIYATNFPPYEFEQPLDGLRGFDVDVVEAAFAREGVVASFRFAPWSRVMKLGRSGAAGAILSCAHTKERERDFLFSEPLSQSTRGFLAHRGRDLPILKTLQDGEGYRLGAVQGYKSAKELQNAGMEVDISQTDAIALRKLKDGRIDLFYTTRETAMFWAGKLFGEADFQFHMISAEVFYLCFGKANPDSERYLEVFNRGLSKVLADGTFESIHARYNNVVLTQ